jgi:hypothetical protein
VIKLVALAMFALVTAAEAAPAALSWTRLPGAEQCIDAPALARAVEARIGEVLVTPSHAEVSIEGRIAPRSGGGWRAVVAVAHSGEAATSQRSIETSTKDCHVLDGSLALVVALLVDPTGAPPAPPPPPEVIIREVRVPVVVHDPWHLAVALRGESEWGALASLTGGGELAAIVTPPGAWDVELSAFWDHSVLVTTDLPGRDVREMFAGIALATCPAWSIGALRLAACGGARLARFAWHGHGFDQDLEGSTLIPAITAEARLELPLTEWLRFAVGAGVRVPVRSVDLSYERSASAGGEDVEIDRTGLSLAASLGVVARAF